MEVSNKQIWDSEEYIFLPLVTELLSIKVMRSPSEGPIHVVNCIVCIGVKENRRVPHSVPDKQQVQTLNGKSPPVFHE